MTAIIYTIKTENHYKLGTPIAHALEEPPDISRVWMTKAEYELPEGFSVEECTDGRLGVFDAAGEYWHIADAWYDGHTGELPSLVSKRSEFLQLKKIREVPW